MFESICANILEAKWNNLKEIDFPLNSKKIAKMNFLSESILQYFFAEINYYCQRLLDSLIRNSNISKKILEDSDFDLLKNILYDWIEFGVEDAKKLLESAIATELFFIINPTKCLTEFLFNNRTNNFSNSENIGPSKNKKNINEITEKNIKDIINEMSFICDRQGIIIKLKKELEELSNTKSEISKKNFIDLVNDVIINLYYNQTIEEFLIPINSFISLSESDTLPIELIEMFLYERDLAGILTNIKKYIVDNEKKSLQLEELANKLRELLENKNISEENYREKLITESESSELDNTIEDDFIYDQTTNNSAIIPSTELEEFIEVVENEIDSTLLVIKEDEMLTETNRPIEIQNGVKMNDKFVGNTIITRINELRSEGHSYFDTLKEYLILERENLENLRNNLL